MLWITTGGEPYQWLAQELRNRFPDFTVLYSPLVGNLNIPYPMPRDQYGKGRYQDIGSVPGPGCLETLCDGVTERAENLLAELRVS